MFGDFGLKLWKTLWVTKMKNKIKVSLPVPTAVPGTACGGMMNTSVNAFQDFSALPEG